MSRTIILGENPKSYPIMILQMNGNPAAHVYSLLLHSHACECMTVPRDVRAYSLSRAGYSGDRTRMHGASYKLKAPFTTSIHVCITYTTGNHQAHRPSLHALIYLRMCLPLPAEPFH